MALQRRLQAIVGDAADGGPGSIAFGDQAPYGVSSLAGNDPYRFRPPGGDAALRRIAGPRGPPPTAHVRHPAVRFRRPLDSSGAVPLAATDPAEPTTVPSVGSPPMLPCVTGQPVGFSATLRPRRGRGDRPAQRRTLLPVGGLGRGVCARVRLKGGNFRQQRESRQHQNGSCRETTMRCAMQNTSTSCLRVRAHALGLRGQRGGRDALRFHLAQHPTDPDSSAPTIPASLACPLSAPHVRAADTATPRCSPPTPA